MCRAFAAARKARSIGSWLASCEANAPANKTSVSCRLFQRHHARDGQLVHGDRAGLVHAQHVHGRGIFGGAQPCDQDAAFASSLEPIAMLT